jgi:hypothetical protein
MTEYAILRAGYPSVAKNYTKISASSEVELLITTYI